MWCQWTRICIFFLFTCCYTWWCKNHQLSQMIYWIYVFLGFLVALLFFFLGCLVVPNDPSLFLGCFVIPNDPLNISSHLFSFFIFPFLKLISFLSSWHIYLLLVVWILVTSFLRRYGISTLKLLSRLIYLTDYNTFRYSLYFYFQILLCPFSAKYDSYLPWSSIFLVGNCSMIADSTSESNSHEAGLHRNDNNCKWMV